MKSSLKFLLVCLTLFSFHKEIKADHIYGADLTYKCVGPSKYVFTANLYADCEFLVSAYLTNAAAKSLFAIYDLCAMDYYNYYPGYIDLSLTREISQLCPSQLPFSKCKTGGTFAGTALIVYHSDTITLPSTCTSFSLELDGLKRTSNITNLPSSVSNQILYLSDTINTSVASCNNSPTFSPPYPIPYVCVNQPVSYNFGTTEIDGNTLKYSIISSLDPFGHPVTYPQGYSKSQPIPGIKIDSLTGQLSFTPAQIGRYSVNVNVSEYTKTGEFIGNVMREIVFIVENCSNNPPSATAGKITNLTGITVQTNPYALSLCEGDSFQFNAVFTDADISDSLTLFSNLFSVLPDAKAALSNSANPKTATISWKAPTGSASKNYTFTITAKDNACPRYGIQSFSYQINVTNNCCTKAGADVTICGTDSAHLSASGGDTFKWSILSGDAAAILSCTACPNPVVKPSKTTTFIVTSNLSAMCNTDTVVVTVTNSTIKVSAGVDTSVCKGSGVTLNVTGGLGNATYSWLPTIGLSKSDIKNPIASPTINTTYTVTVNNGGCAGISKDSITVKVNDLPTVKTSAGITICPGKSTSISANAGLSSYKWSPTNTLSNSTIYNPTASPTATTTYTVTGTDAKGCKNTDTVVVKILQSSDTSFTLTSPICVGNVATIIYTGDSIPGSSYTWDFGGGTAVSGTSKGPYKVKWNTEGNKKIALLINANGCSSNSTKNISVSPIPPAPSVTTPASVCKGNVTGNIIANSAGGSLKWYSDSQLQNLVYTGNAFSSGAISDTTFWVTETKAGCTSPASTANLVFYALPNVSFNANPKIGNLPLNVIFTNTSSPDVTGFLWDLENGITESVPNPSHTYNAEGTFVVTLTGKNANSCIDTAQATIVVHPFSSLVIPNVFTPNGDNVNDVFKVQASGMKEFEVVIYNRWGTVVSTLKDTNQGWDGLNCEDGTYYYIIKAIGADGQTWNQPGHVLLISKKQ